MVNVIIILLSFISLALSNSVMSPSELMAGVDKNNHLMPEEAITVQVKDTDNHANQMYDDSANDNYNQEEHLPPYDERANTNGQSSNKLNDMHRASTSQSRVVQNISPWNDLSSASSNSKSNGHQGFFQ